MTDVAVPARLLEYVPSDWPDEPDEPVPPGWAFEAEAFRRIRRFQRWLDARREWRDANGYTQADMRLLMPLGGACGAA
jgi:hypothetical protein